MSSAGTGQQSSPDCSGKLLASGESERLTCQCFRVMRATSFWSNGSKWSGFHHFSSQSVLQCMLCLGQGTAGTVLMGEVLIPESGGQMSLKTPENKHISLQVTAQQQRSYPWTPHHPDASLLLASTPISWRKKRGFSKWCIDVCI